MPNPENFTPHRSIRVPNETWIPAMRRARVEGTSVGEICRQFLDWWLRKPGAKLPSRPPAERDPESANRPDVPAVDTHDASTEK